MSIRLIPNEIVKITGGRFISGIGLTMIDGIYVDDRKVAPGSLFVPLKGSRHASIEKAFQKGAVATLVNRDGKTSSRTFANNPKKIFIEVEDTLSALMEMARFWRYKLGINFLAVTGNKNSSNVKGLAFNVINSSIPAAEVPDSIADPLELSLFMIGMKASHKKILINLGSALSEYTEKLIYNSEPSTLIITDTSKKDIKALTKIISAIEKEKTLILNADDISFAALNKSAECNILTFGTKDADICAEKNKKTGFVLKILKEKIEISLKVTKEISISDYLAAAAAAHAAGLGIEEIKKGLEGIDA